MENKQAKIMLNIICYQEDANENHKEIPLHTHQNGQNQELTTLRAEEDTEQQGTLILGWWECKMVQPFGKTVWWFLSFLQN